MESVMITGCNRGIGLGLVRQFLALKKAPKHVIATCRNKDKAPALIELSQKHENLKILEVELKDFNRYDDLAKKLESITQDAGLNLLINNAGISTKFSRINLLKMEQLIDNFVINTAAPLMLTKVCLPLLKKASVKNSSKALSIERAAVVNISSILGSISENKDGGFYPYRCSKAALNAATKSMSLDLKNDQILVVAIHPGWCKTDMGGKNAPLEVDSAANSIIKVLGSLTEVHSGTFLQYDGQSLSF